MSETSDQLKARFTTGHVVNQSDMTAMVDTLAVSSSTKETLKSYFETGDKPTQAQFYELIDAIFAQQKTDLNWVNADNYIYGKSVTRTTTVTFNNYQHAVNCDGQTNSILTSNVLSNTSTNQLSLHELFGHTLSSLGAISQIQFTIQVNVASSSANIVMPMNILNYTVSMPFMYTQDSFIGIENTRAALLSLAKQPLGVCNMQSFGYYPYNDLMLWLVPYIAVYDQLNTLAICGTFIVMSSSKPQYAFNFATDAQTFTTTVDVETKVISASVLRGQDTVNISVS